MVVTTGEWGVLLASSGSRSMSCGTQDSPHSNDLLAPRATLVSHLVGAQYVSVMKEDAIRF